MRRPGLQLERCRDSPEQVEQLPLLGLAQRGRHLPVEPLRTLLRLLEELLAGGGQVKVADATVTCVGPALEKCTVLESSTIVTIQLGETWSRSASAFCGAPSFAATARRRGQTRPVRAPTGRAPGGSAARSRTRGWRDGMRWSETAVSTIRRVGSCGGRYVYATATEPFSNRTIHGQGVALLARLAHVVARHRWKVIGAWIALTLFGGVAAAQVHSAGTTALAFPEAGVRGEPADAQSVRGGDAAAGRRRVSHRRRRTKSTAIAAAMQRAAAALPGALTSSYYSTALADLRLARPAHDVRGDLPARRGDAPRRARRRRCEPQRRTGCRTGSRSR